MARENKKDELISELTSHYQAWTDDISRRISRKNGWRDVTDCYWGVLPEDWPFRSRVVDPRVRTILIEKNARITGGRIVGRVVPREDTDAIKARILQQLLDYQWQMADDGGSMQTKLSICDMDARLYGTKFALVEWRVRKDNDGGVTYEGNELKPLDIRDCGIDPAASHIRDAKWFQLRQWVTISDLESAVDSDGKPLFTNIGLLKKKLRENVSDKRVEYSPRVLEIQGRDDYLGRDKAFPVFKIVTEFRRDKWITFSPTFNLILREIDNPYKHGKIPIAQLRYHPIQDDPLGESEVEPVLPLWRAIQAVLCGYMDCVLLELNKPLKVTEGQARLETIVYRPQAIWLVNNPNAVVEHATSTATIQYFQTTYLALVSALNTAMGATSQGVSNIDPTQTAKTATEIKASLKQQTVVDQDNLIAFGEFIKDIIAMWIANNQQFLFSDKDKHYQILKVVGKEQWEFFQNAGFGEMVVPYEAQQAIADIITQNPDTTEDQLSQLVESAKLPKYPIIVNPKEKDPLKYKIVPKLKIADVGQEADLYVEENDIVGRFDFVPDVRTMSVGFGEEKLLGYQSLLATLTTNTAVLELLRQEGFRPKIKELLEAIIEGSGVNDPERFFEKENGDGQVKQPQTDTSGATEVLRGTIPTLQNTGVAESSEAASSVPSPEPMG